MNGSVKLLFFATVTFLAHGCISRSNTSNDGDFEVWYMDSQAKSYDDSALLRRLKNTDVLRAALQVMVEDLNLTHNEVDADGAAKAGYGISEILMIYNLRSGHDDYFEISISHNKLLRVRNGFRVRYFLPKDDNTPVGFLRESSVGKYLVLLVRESAPSE